MTKKARSAQFNKFLILLLSDQKMRDKLRSARNAVEVNAIVKLAGFNFAFTAQQAAVFTKHYQHIRDFRLCLDDVIKGSKIPGNIVGFVQ